MTQKTETTQPKKRSGYLQTSAIFVILSLASAAINYLFYPIIARFLSVEEFGATQTLIAIVLQVSAIFSGLNLVTIYLVRKLPDSEAKNAIELLQKVTILIFVLLALLVLLFSGSIMSFLHIDSLTYLLLVSLSLVSSVPFIIAFGALQAKRHFIAAGTLQLSVVTTKLVAGALLAKTFGIGGALLAITIGQLLGIVLFWLYCKSQSLPLWDHSMLSIFKMPRRRDFAVFKGLSASLVAIFMLNVTLALFISFDIITVRHYFSPSLSGLYAGASTISNAIVFVSLPLISVLLPNLNLGSFRKSMPVFVRTTGLILLSSMAGTFVLYLMPRFLLGIFGESYQAQSDILYRLGIIMSLLALMCLALQVSAFYRPLSTALIVVTGFMALVLSIQDSHQTIESIVSTITVVFASILTIGAIQLVSIYIHDKSSKTT